MRSVITTKGIMRNTSLNIRTTDKTKHLLQQVSDMLGTTVSGFLLSCATEKAYEIIQNQNSFFLAEEEWDKLCKDLDRSPIKNKKLQRLIHAKRVFTSE